MLEGMTQYFHFLLSDQGNVYGYSDDGQDGVQNWTDCPSGSGSDLFTIKFAANETRN